MAPKLNPNLATGVKKAVASSGFTPMDEGNYRARLTEVVAKNAASSGNPMWVWQYEIIEDPYSGRKQWNNTVLTDAALWKVGESFAAFGVPEDTDTDELIGCTVVLEISQRTITQGQREGQIGNNIDRVLPDMDSKAVRHRESTLDGGQGRPSAAGASAPNDVEAGNRF
jgi:hypothetical protein